MNKIRVRFNLFAFLILVFSAFCYGKDLGNQQSGSLSQLGLLRTIGHVDFYKSSPEMQHLKNEYLKTQETIKSGHAVEWKTKIFIIKKSEILEKSNDGIYRQRRSNFEKAQIQKIANSIANFKALAETYGKGNIKISLDIHEENEPYHWILEKPQTILNQDFIQKTFGPRINSDKFDPNDKIYRGPYHSVFFIHPFLTEPSETQIIRSTPVSGIAFYTHPKTDLKNGLALLLYDKWLEHLSIQAKNKGYKMPIIQPKSNIAKIAPSSAIITHDMWKIVGNQNELKDKDYYRNRFKGKVLFSRNWDKVKSDPWHKLHKLKCPQNLLAQNYLLIELKDNTQKLYLDSTIADQAINLLNSSGRPDVLGYTYSKKKLYVVIQGENWSKTKIEDLISKINPQTHTQIYDKGFFKTASQKDTTLFHYF